MVNILYGIRVQNDVVENGQIVSKGEIVQLDEKQFEELVKKSKEQGKTTHEYARNKKAEIIALPKMVESK